MANEDEKATLAKLATREYVHVYTDTRLEQLLEQAKGVVTAIKGAIARNVDPLAQRLATVETRVAAVSMLLARPNTKAANDLANIETLLARIDALEKRSATSADVSLESRVKELEARPALVYRGVWNADEEYREGNFVSDHGSLWHCKYLVTHSRPRESPAWVLVAKGRH